MNKGIHTKLIYIYIIITIIYTRTNLGEDTNYSLVKTKSVNRNKN